MLGKSIFLGVGAVGLEVMAHGLESRDVEIKGMNNDLFSLSTSKVNVI